LMKSPVIRADCRDVPLDPLEASVHGQSHAYNRRQRGRGRIQPKRRQEQIFA